MFVVVIMFLLGLAAIFAPMALDANFVVQIVLLAVGIILIGFAAYLAMYKKFFVVPEANEALIRTGGIGKKKQSSEVKIEGEGEGSKVQVADSQKIVAIGTGLWVIPMFHKLKRLKFQQIVLPINRQNDTALVCQDMRLANVKATFKMKVNETISDVLKFVNAAGERDLNDEDTYRRLYEDTLDTALRDACTSRPYDQVFEGREKVGNTVEESVMDDFSKSGACLVSAKLTDVDPTPLQYYKDDNPQHAIGKAAIVQITEDQRLVVESKKLSTDQAIRAKQVDKEKAVLALNQDEAEKTAEQAKAVRLAQIAAEEAAERREIEKNENLEKRNVAKDEAVQLASVEKDKKLEVAQKAKEQAAETAEIEKQKTVAIADQNKQIEVANKEKEKAAAEAEKFTAKAEEEKAAQNVKTVEAVKSAERLKETAIIAEQAEAEKTKVKENMRVDVDAYKITATAKAGKEAADNKAQAIKVEAAAKKEAQVMDAEGRKAVEMIPVEVAKEQVEVERKKVQVEDERVLVLTKELKAKSENTEISMKLELGLAEINADKEARIAAAKALGEAFSNADMQLFGSNEMLDKIFNKFTAGQAVAKSVDGFVSGLEGDTADNILNTVLAIGDKFGITPKEVVKKDAEKNKKSE